MMIARRDIGMEYSGRSVLFAAILSVLIILLTSCGLRDTSESVPIGEDPEGFVPVAEFHDMRLTTALDYFWKYTFSEDWLYCTARKRNGSYTIQELIERNAWVVYRNGIYDAFEPQVYIEREGGFPLVLLADRENDLFIFCQDDSGGFSLEKYDADGEMRWHAGYTASQMSGLGSSVGDGIVTADGRIFLFTYGQEGNVFEFGMTGELQEIYTPDVETLEGIAEGQDGRVYGYCLTCDPPVFVPLEEGGERFECPIVPLQVFGGREDGIYLCTGEGQWKYEPTSGRTERMWNWDDEYIQIDGAHIGHIFRGREDVRLLCLEPHTFIWGLGDVLTFVSVTPRERRDYPPRQTVTISNAMQDPGSHMDDMVRQYNRQNREYRVVVLPPEENSSVTEFVGALELQLIRGEAPDLINVLGTNVNSLADKGVFEELDKYYETSSAVKEGDIFEAVREAGKVGGKEILVIPSFVLGTMMTTESVPQESWTPPRFLELTQYGALYNMPMSKGEAFDFCLGARPEEYFVDYEKRECYFDSAAFKNILAECNKWEQGGSADHKSFFDIMLHSADSYMNYKEMYKGEYLGYPGWSGAESVFYSSEIFAVNSASPNKQGAWDFLEFLLSEEMQDRIDWQFPVRIDSFEKYLYMTSRSAEENKSEFSYYLSDISPITPEDIAAFQSLIDNAVFRDSTLTAVENPVRTILWEETQAYFAGDATLDETVEKIQNRVKMYLDEM